MTAHTDDTNHVKTDSTVLTGMNIYESNIWKSATGSLGLKTKIDSRSEISFSVDYLFYHNDNPSTYDNTVFVEQHNNQALSKIDLSKSTPIHIFIARADYQYEISPSFSWEAGVKSVTSTLDNNVLVQQLVDNVLTTDPNVYILFDTERTYLCRLYFNQVAPWKPAANQ